jgi:hypothetical protein
MFRAPVTGLPVSHAAVQQRLPSSVAAATIADVGTKTRGKSVGAITHSSTVVLAQPFDPPFHWEGCGEVGGSEIRRMANLG